MSRKIIILGLLVGLLFAGSSLSFCFGQDEVIAEYAYGTVSKADSEKIVISQYDYNKDEEVEVIYYLDSTSELKNITVIDKSLIGKNVEIDYFLKDHQKVIKTISLDIPASGDNSFPEEDSFPGNNLDSPTNGQ